MSKLLEFLVDVYAFIAFPLWVSRLYIIGCVRSCMDILVISRCYGRRKQTHLMRKAGKSESEYSSHFYSTPPSSHTTSRRANGRSRQRTRRIRCHRLHLPLGHVQYVYSTSETQFGVIPDRHIPCSFLFFL